MPSKREQYRSLTTALRSRVGQRMFADIDTMPGSYAISPEQLAERAIRGLAVGITKRVTRITPGDRSGAFFIEIPKDIEVKIGDLGAITGRMEVVIQRQTFVSGIMQSAVPLLVTRHVPAMRQIVEGVIRSNVYNTPAQITRYGTFEAGLPTETGEDYNRTYNLLYMFMSGFRHYVRGVKFEIDNSLAPYWLWVEKGHRVVLPDGTEPGTFVGERPFVDQYKDRLNAYIDNVIMPEITRYMSVMRDVIGVWTLYGEEYKKYLGAVSVSKFPHHFQISEGDYRSPEFYRFVGVRND